MSQNVVLRFFIAMLGLFISSTAYSYSFVSEGIYYNILSDKASVEVTYRNTNYDTYIGEVIIPSEVSYNGNTYTVTGIGSRAFYKCSTVTSITLPPTINKIGLYAFQDANHIQRVNISNLTSWCMMDVDSYYSCPLVYGGILYLNNSPVSSLESLDSSCTTIAKYAFFGNTYLTNVVLPESIKSVQAAAFRGCSNMAYLEVGSNVTSMGDGAFISCSSLKTIKFCNSNQKLMLGRYEYGKIYKYFKDCPLTTVYIGRDIDWADDSYNYEYYYPFTTVKTAVFNGTKASDYGFSNLLNTAYVGTACKELSFSSKKLSNLFVFTNDITRAYLGSTTTNIYVIDKSNVPSKISELTYQSINNLVEIHNLQNGASYIYGNTPTVDSNNFINNVVDMSLNISASSLESSVGFHDLGISLTLSNNLWDVNFNVPYSYSVTPAPLTVIANDVSKKYGMENPELTCSFFGFKNGETKDVLTRMPKVETTATISSGVGTYPIIPTGGEAQNYTFNYERGTLTITKADQTIEWEQQFGTVNVGDVVELTATSSADLPVKYTSTDESIAEIFAQGGKKYVEFLKPGNVSLCATQEGNENYNEADRVSKSVKVGLLVSAITLNQNYATLTEGNSLQLTATVTPANASNITLSWESTNPEIATVDANGKVTAVSVGKATIKATAASGISATCEVTVVEMTAGSVVIDKDALGITGDNLDMRVGDVKTIKVSVEPETTTDKSVTFASSAPEVATVDTDGKVTALALGKTIITITAKSGVSTSITVTVVATPAGYITLNKTSATLKATETLDLIATILPETTTDKSVTWSTSDAAIATVDANGKITAVSVGKATIKATAASGISATCEVTVVETTAGSVVIDKDALGITGDNLEMRVGDTKTINVTVEPATATDKSVTFSSSAPEVAIVDADGKVTALTLGQTTITITAKSGVSATINVIVVATPAASITLNKTEATLKATETVALVATVDSDTVTDKSVIWSSSDNNIATVDENGVVTAVAVGKATITATTANGLNATCEITVVHRDVPEPTATINGEQFDVLSGESLNLKVSYTGGLDSGWSFDWRINGSQNPIADKAEYSFVETTAGKYSVSVRIVNNCDGELIYDQTFTIAVRVWDLPELPGEDGIELDAPTSATGIDGVVRVRQDDTLVLSVEEGRGGYADGWTYDWCTAGNVIGIGSEIETTATMKEGEAKAIERRTYNVDVRNISPDGAIWAENTLSIATDVYRRPVTPSSLVRKGDGATHTFVCMLTVADNQLSPLGYGFVYGYDAADGSEHEIARTPKRYCRASEQVYNNPSDRFWVYAVWTYEDGSTVSSGKRYLDGSVDEDFNASVFDPSQTGTRGSDFSQSDNWIKVSGKSIGISVDSDSDTYVTLYNAGGIMIRSLTVEAGTSVRERIDLSTFTAGIYIVNVTSGNEAVSRKFIVK